MSAPIGVPPAAAEPAAPTQPTGPLVGLGPLLRVQLHQDARAIAPWVVLISALSATSILAYTWIFPDPADRQMLAATLGTNPTLALVFGPRAT